MAIVDLFINGLLVAGVAIAALLLATGVRFLIAWSRDDVDTGEAARISGRWAGLVIGGAAAAGAIGLVQFGDILSMVTMFIGQHPYAVTNLGILGIGAAIIEGLVDLSVEQYIGLAFAIMGGTFVLSEVFD